jgi:hypothetical protein
MGDQYDKHRNKMAKQPIKTGRVIAPTPGDKGMSQPVRTGIVVGCLSNVGFGTEVVRTGGRAVAASPDPDLGKGMAGERLVAPTYDGMTGYGMAGMRLVRPPENQDI